MVEGKSIMEQVHEFENIIYYMKMKDITVHETILVTLLIKRLPSLWTEFGRSLKQKPEDFSFNDLLVSLRIEEKHRESQKLLLKPDFQAKVLIVENHHKHKPKPKILKKNSFGKSNFNNKPRDKNFNQQIVGGCWVCGKTNHKARDCHFRKDQPPRARGPSVIPKP